MNQQANQSIFTPRKMIFIAMMGALSMVLMLLRFPLPFAPSFMEFDISELPALFCGFFMGPVGGVFVVIIKNLLKIAVQGSQTAFVGDMMNVVSSILFVLPASLIYRKLHTRKGAVIGMTVSTILVSVVLVFMNAFIAFPMYASIYGIPLDALIGMGTAINPHITNLLTMMLFSVLPFNLFKHGVTSVVTYLLYKKCGTVLRPLLSPPAKPVPKKT